MTKQHDAIKVLANAVYLLTMCIHPASSQQAQQLKEVQNLLVKTKLVGGDD